MPGPWKRLGERRLFSTRLFHIDEHKLESPRTQRAHDFWILGCADWCNIVALTPDEEVVMVRQHRYGSNEETLELPGGMIDPDDVDAGAGAARELEEETGYRAARVEPIGVIAPNPALQSNRTFSFLARNVERVGAPRLDGGEDIEVVLVPYREIPERIRIGQITHALVVVAFAHALGLKSPA